jgi:hypothetical protein
MKAETLEYSVHISKYRDTSRVGVEAYRSILLSVDRLSLKGKRDYAILRLLGDNALRGGELVATNVGCTGARCESSIIDNAALY